MWRSLSLAYPLPIMRARARTDAQASALLILASPPWSRHVVRPILNKDSEHLLPDKSMTKFNVDPASLPESQPVHSTRGDSTDHQQQEQQQ